MTNQTMQAVLEGLADTMRNRLMPALGDDSFAHEQARLAAGLLTIAAKQVDGVAAVRAADNADMRALFGDAALIVANALDGDLAAELALAARGTDPGLAITELDREGGRLRSLLVELHAALEDIDGTAALAMHQRVWCLLRDMEMRRG